MRIDRRKCIAIALAAGGVPRALAQAPAEVRRYGALSVIGDRLTVVVYQPMVGTSINRNERQAIPVASTEIDDAALLAVRGGLPAAAAPAVSFYRVATEHFSEWQRLVDTGTVMLPADVDAALKRDGVTHLVLVTRLRAPASVQLQEGRTGSGMLEGLGFYLDHGIEVTESSTGAVGKGFIAPYAYLQVALIDVAARRIVGREAVRAAVGRSAASSRTGRDPWTALTPDEKGRLIDTLLTREVGRAVARLTAG